MPTIAEALRRAERALAPIADCADSADAKEVLRIEAEMLLTHVLGTDRAHLLARMGDELPKTDLAAFDELVQRRLRREPLSYIVGACEFFGVEIVCTPAALIPRPETEMLVEFVLEESRGRERDFRVADIGTGTGAIAIAVAVNAQNLVVTASDASGDALELARANATRNGVDPRVTFVYADLLDGLGEFDLIIANLPYVRECDWVTLAPEIREHEPRSAFVGGATGLEIIERLLRSAPGHLAVGGALAVEVGDTHGAAALALGKTHFPGADVCVMKDFAGLDRMLVVRT